MVIIDPWPSKAGVFYLDYTKGNTPRDSDIDKKKPRQSGAALIKYH